MASWAEGFPFDLCFEPPLNKLEILLILAVWGRSTLLVTKKQNSLNDRPSFFSPKAGVLRADIPARRLCVLSNKP